MLPCVVIKVAIRILLWVVIRSHSTNVNEFLHKHPLNWMASCFGVQFTARSHGDDIIMIYLMRTSLEVTRVVLPSLRLSVSKTAR